MLIPRGAVLLEASRTLPDADQAKALLATGVADYEKTLALQAQYFKYLSEHSCGELLFGLAEGQHRLGARDKARLYFDRLFGDDGSCVAEESNRCVAPAWVRRLSSNEVETGRHDTAADRSVAPGDLYDDHCKQSRIPRADFGC